MRVLFCDLWKVEKVVSVSNRDEAVKVIKEELSGYCQDGDRIAWYMSDDDEKRGRTKPSLACVIDPYGESIDYSATIDYEE